MPKNKSRVRGPHLEKPTVQGSKPQKAKTATKSKEKRPASAPKRRKRSPRSNPTKVKKESTSTAVLPRESTPAVVSDEQRRAVGVALLEILNFPAALLADLPKAFAIRCHVQRVDPRDDDGEFVIVTSQARYTAARAAGVPAFTGSEWRALSRACEHGRVGRRELRKWLALKRKNPSWNLTSHTAYDAGFGCVPTLAKQKPTWRVGQVLSRLHANIIKVEMSA